ncbi:low temperature requirement protein A [Rhizobium sp. TH2]|uniref:low temperature requirement protein A n=1 Tax=Rhizobium sp. TH2 TaxID=2775403 RepID=UPI00215815E1|nr:low temperature requirement protein A [Rhizobium sp. TH2]
MPSSPKPPTPEELHHHVTKMGGRDPHEEHRTATPLELLFDLTFVIAFGLAASQFAHALAEGHYFTAITGFSFACFAICWAWINFSWFASAYDTDDWIFRVVTMVQMIGVIVLAIGLPRMFASIEHGGHFDNGIMVLGYVIMRVALIFQWLRAARQDPSRRQACMAYVVAITIAQIGWIVLIFIDFSLLVTFIMATALVVVEMAGPYIAERKFGGTPWHAHHIVERYGLLAIIALGEGVVGTVASLSAVVDGKGWTMDAGLVCIAGVGLTFAMWWMYYTIPSAHVLHVHRERSFIWGYSHMIIFAAIVATGAGLHVAAYYIDQKAHIGAVATLMTVALPVLVYVGAIYALYTYMVQEGDRFHVWLIAATLVVFAVSIAAAAAGINLTYALIVLMFAPIVTVVGYEFLGHRHQAEALERDLEKSGTVH